MFAPELKEAPDARCSLCARTQAQVHFLVRGVVGSICSDCVAASVQLLGDKIGDPAIPNRARLNRKLELVPIFKPVETLNFIEIDSDVFEIFPDSLAVNAALRPLATLIKDEVSRRSADVKD